MKSNSTLIKIPIEWLGTDAQSYTCEGAIYPEEYKGFPIISIRLEDKQVSDFAVSGIRKTKFHQSLQEKLGKKFMVNFNLVTLRKLAERGSEVVILDILPIDYDSASNTYFRIDYLEIELKNEIRQSPGSNARTGGTGGNSVLANGNWYRIPVTKSGIHKLDYNYLSNAGINVTGLNPKKIRLYGNGGGMLPQKNSDDRPEDLIENAIMVSGNADGRFDREDFILFYGQDADHHQLIENGELEYQKNFYSDTTYYFLTVSGDDGLRIAEREDLGSQHPKIKQFDDYIFYEKDEFNIIYSGRDWYGEKFDFTLTYDFSFDFNDLIPDTELNVTTSIMGQTYEEASLDLFVNGQFLGQQTINAIVDGSYLAKGSVQKESYTMNTSIIPPMDKFTLRLSYNPVGSGKSRANLDYLTIQGKRSLKLYGNQTIFRSLESTQYAISTFEIENGSSAYRIWDITDPLKPYNQKFSLIGSAALFGSLSAELKEYIVFTDEDFLVPEAAVQIHNQNLHASPDVDFLIVTYPGFRNESERLADFRRNNDGLRVLVASTHEIYNEFSSGKQDVTAIRDFIKYLYDQGTDGNRLQHVLLFGKGSFDYKDRVDKNSNFVPIYSSRNSLHPINSYSSDDYFGFLDENEGEWVESYTGDQLMDIGVGRLPVKTIDEARIVVDKLINYSTNPATFGSWRNELIFVADDGDGNLHQRDADRLTNLVDTSYTQFDTKKIYIDAFEQIESSIGETAPEANATLERSIERGGLIVNFTGHGSATRWTSETILNITSISEYKNKDRLPLFVTATCEFGRHDNPFAISGAEYLLLNPKGGAIGLLTTARPVFSSTNFILNQAFYENVFRKEEGKYLPIGEIFRKTKNQSLNGSVNRNFSLLADPSMVLTYARDEIVLIADDESYQPGDTLSALSTVKLKGQVLDSNGTLNASFNGNLVVTVFDKPSEMETLGHEDLPMKYYVRDNIIFKGEVSVISGEFSIEFIVPKNITFDFEKGKVSMYALDKNQRLDAAGSNIEFVVGGESDDYLADTTPPEIELFINDTSFVNGGITRPDVFLVAQLSDESGISLSKSDEGYDLTAILDNDHVSVVNDYYISEIDTYKQGWVTYPYKDLSIGIHKIQLMAWDVHNNFNEAEIEFLVVEDENLAIEKLINYPNPFSESTHFSFEHNRAGDDLEIMIDIYSMQGKLVKQIGYSKENSESRISDIYWDGKEENGSNLQSGVYLFRLSIRSLIDGSKNQANHKLVIIN